MYVLGEIAGPGVQRKMHYGLGEPAFLAFDVCQGGRSRLEWKPPHEARMLCEERGIAVVPLIHQGPYTQDAEAGWAEGPSLCDSAGHRREGAVIRLEKERTDERIGRIILKRVSERYLARATGEEIQ